MKLKDQRAVSVDSGCRIWRRVRVEWFSLGGREEIVYRRMGEGITSMVEVAEDDDVVVDGAEVDGAEVDEAEVPSERCGFFCVREGDGEERVRLSGGGLMGLVRNDIPDISLEAVGLFDAVQSVCLVVM